MQPNLALTTLTLSSASVFFLQTLKKAKWFPWLTKETAKLNRLASVALAAVTAWGISYKWSPEHAAGLLGTITIGIPTLAVFGLGLWHWVIQFVSQETIYRATSDFGVAEKVFTEIEQIKILAAVRLPGGTIDTDALQKAQQATQK